MQVQLLSRCCASTYVTIALNINLIALEKEAQLLVKSAANFNYKPPMRKIVGEK
jgi:hypothetical protein